MRDKLPLIVILGPTASGKTSLAIELAQKYKGEIICADSRTIYKYMDIGTAKPTIEEREIVPHWGLDLIDPGDYFTAADFKEYAIKKIDEIRSRGHLPFLVGGSGLYIDSVIFDYNFGTKRDEKLREELGRKSIEELYKYCEENNIALPENDKNKRYIIRNIENSGNDISNDNRLIDNCIVVGITTTKEELIPRIAQRVKLMMNLGIVKEAVLLLSKYGHDRESMKSNMYRSIYECGDNNEAIIDRTITLDWQLAKKQMTWFKRNRFIKWYKLENIEEYISSCLAQNE